MPPLSDRTKKLLMVVLFIAVVLGLAVALYVAFFRTAPTAPDVAVTPPGTGSTFPSAGTSAPSGSNTGGPGTLPGSGTSGIDIGTVPTPIAPAEVPRAQTLVDTQTQFASLDRASGDSGMRYYNPADGKFYRVNDLGEIDVLSDKAFYNVETVSWASASDKAILEFPDGSNVLYDFASSRQVSLPKHWEDFAFAPSDAQIIAKSMGNNETNRYLVISNADGSEAKAIQELGDNGDKVETAWTPNNQIVAYAHTGEALGYDREQIVLIGKNKENLPGLVTEGRGFIPEWSPQGNNLLYSVYTSENGYLPELWLSGGTADTINKNRRRVQLNTWADKCAWAGETTVYCAVPSLLPAGAALQRETVSKGGDQLYRIDVATGSKTNLGAIDGIYDARSLTVSADQKTVYALDATSGQIVKYDVSRK